MCNNKQNVLIIQNNSTAAAVISNLAIEYGLNPVIPPFSNFALDKILNECPIGIMTCDIVFDNDFEFDVSFDLFSVAKENDKNIKIIVMTPEDDELVRELAFTLGADAFLKYPFTINQFEKILEKIGYEVQ